MKIENRELIQDVASRHKIDEMELERRLLEAFALPCQTEFEMYQILDFTSPYAYGAIKEALGITPTVQDMDEIMMIKVGCGGNCGRCV